MNSCDEAVQTAKLAEYIKLKTEEDIHFLAKNSKMLIFKNPTRHPNTPDLRKEVTSNSMSQLSYIPSGKKQNYILE